jgi:hypothetical protein
MDEVLIAVVATTVLKAVFEPAALIAPLASNPLSTWGSCARGTT